MKKIFAMILAAAMVFAMTACSVEFEKKETNEEPETVQDDSVLYYTASTFAEESGLPFEVELPDVLGDVAEMSVVDGFCIFQMTTYTTVVAIKLSAEDSFDFFQPKKALQWVRNGTAYTAISLSDDLKNELIAYIGNLPDTVMIPKVLGEVLKAEPIENGCILRMSGDISLEARNTEEPDRSPVYAEKILTWTKDGISYSVLAEDGILADKLIEELKKMYE